MKVTIPTTWELGGWATFWDRNWFVRSGIYTKALRIYSDMSWKLWSPDGTEIARGKARTRDEAVELTNAALEAWVLEQGGEV